MNDPTHSRRFNMSRVIIIAVALVITTAVVWSIFAPLDQIARAQGQVIPTSRVQVIQSLDGGQITEIRVREGDRVKAGDLLVVLDKVKLGASVEETRARVAALTATMSRIEAELFERPLRFEAVSLEYPEFVNNQRALYARRRQALASQISSLDRLYTMAGDELDLNRPLVETGDVAAAEIIRMERSQEDIRRQQAQVQDRYVQDLQTEFTRTQEELVSAEQELTARQDALENAEIFSPVDGIVKNVRLTTVGGVLGPGDEVMTIVPLDNELIVEARVSPSDIAEVKVGQPAEVKFGAYDASIYGGASGEVILVSPDTLTDQTSEGPSDPYYRVQVRSDTSTMRPRPGETIEIQPGMIATAEIKIGTQTVFEYLSKPILKTADEALTEK
ncbi:HlyD family type I secretion periplasmic adaptor subunit [Erythrobacter sp.]|jgi:adhesin transport system membrane fusion protein|uniref:HlyD family type I secretion periplasmic adaptor subunit n=1 Tax=Erythrobacter sp. TaxID=1042 RepID=UPI002ECC539B|nr:HlyD family type I secretion periplasmic adaptor subunit [Erythrobacter sp.]